jgi:cellobiose phosphorylase
VNRYKVEPYVVAGDVYGVDPHTGRGGWTWYTGSAGWMYRVAMEVILGFKREGDQLRMDPCIAQSWEGFELTYRFGSTIYQISIHNPHHVEKGIVSIQMDNLPMEGQTIPLKEDGKTYRIQIQMGAITS